MSKVGVDKFRFVSPGVFIAEIDQSMCHEELDKSRCL